MNTNEPGAAVLAIFNQLINRVKQAGPVRSDDKPLGGGRVYSMMTLGMPVDPVDFVNPWTPQGDINVKDAVAQGTAPAAPAPAAPAGGTAAPAPPPPPDPKAARALAAASQEVATKLFDTHVNLGLGSAVMIAQHALGFQPSDIDGDMGPMTVNAINAATPASFLAAMINLITTHYKLLESKNPRLMAFDKGWMARANKLPPVDSPQGAASQAVSA